MHTYKWSEKGLIENSAADAKVCLLLTLAVGLYEQVRCCQLRSHSTIPRLAGTKTPTLELPTKDLYVDPGSAISDIPTTDAIIKVTEGELVQKDRQRNF